MDRKVSRLARLARERDLGGIVLSAQHNFAWLTAGRSNRIDAARETGSAALFVTADERRFVLANNIESARMLDETLDGLGFEPIAYSWVDERATPRLPVESAARVVDGAPLGTDTGAAGTELAEPWLSTLRCRLEPTEVSRYRELGLACGRIVGDVVRGVPVGITERDVARHVARALGTLDIRATVLLVGADARIDRYRHPVATDTRWRDRLMVVLCAEREGLVVALSRLVATRADPELARRTRAAAHVCAALVEASVPGTSGRELFAIATRAYEHMGFAGEERRHHQGGAIAYRSREWVAHPASAEQVALPQAFAWNPSITGTKVEETILVDDQHRIEVLTGTPGWPSIEVDIRGHAVLLPAVLMFDR